MANDTILFVFGPDYNGQVLDSSSMTLGDPLNAADWQDTLKYSNGIAGFTHFLFAVYGGTEDCADFNNGATDIHLTAKIFSSGGKYCFTIKGGSRDIRVHGGIARHGKEVDVDIGNWSDQSSEKTTGVALDLHTADGSPVTVRVLNGDKPTLVEGSGPYRYLFPHPDNPLHGFFVWWFLKFHRFFK